MMDGKKNLLKSVIWAVVAVSLVTLASVVSCSAAALEVIGAEEHVTILPAGMTARARIDTGATTSSIGISSSQRFERDGKQWIKFSIKDRDSDKTIEFEEPITRIANIKRHGAEVQNRPTVKLTIELGQQKMKREFTLADRVKFKYPVLIGRNVLTGHYVVDVSKKYSGIQAQEQEK